MDPPEQQTTNHTAIPTKQTITSLPFLDLPPETPPETSTNGWEDPAANNGELNNDRTLAVQWEDGVKKIVSELNRSIQWIANKAAINPKASVAITVFTAIALVVIGYFVGFNFDGMGPNSWMPIGSRTAAHQYWIQDESGLVSDQRNIMFNVHADGANVGEVEGVRRAFEVVDAVRNLPRFEEFCYPGVEIDGEKFAHGCPLWGVTQFWDNNVTLFEDQVQTDIEVMNSMSSEKFPDGTYVHPTSILGNVGMLFGNVVFVQSFPLYMVFPVAEEVDDFEIEVMNTIFKIQENWVNEGSNYHATVFTPRSMPDELDRASLTDAPLVPFCFVVMALFTCLVFARRDPVKSRSVLGVGAVVSVVLAMMIAYGFMFTLGVPFSAMSQLFPMIMFGIGLDDAFIILGSYARTDPKKDPVQRINETMADIGSSIFLTTITSSSAFAVGSISSIPVVRDLCHYAYVTILVNFIVIITFFVALVVLDERRIVAKRRDCCACCIYNGSNNHSGDEESMEDYQESKTDNTASEAKKTSSNATKEEAHISDRIMDWYANQLLRPSVRIAVLVLFGAFFVSMCYSSTRLEQEFDFTDALPDGSYVTNYFLSATEYSDQTKNRPAVYFRCVDQSNEFIQNQMEKYIKELVDLDEIDKEPKFFWLADLKKVVDHGDLHHLTFNEQLDIFLDIPVFKEIYKRDIVRHEITGDIIVSRTVLEMNNVNQRVIQSMTNALKHQRDVSKAQFLNTPAGLSNRTTMYDEMCKDPDNWAFFSFEEQYTTWEFYTNIIPELIFSTVTAIAAVTVIGTLLIPHWTAFLFIFPLITITYFNLLGFLQMFGAQINAVFYVTMVMSIGLMVDFIMHILLRYYECDVRLNRRERVIETLSTMGASVLLGGTSSFLGVIPLAFSTTVMISSIFLNFISLIVIGVTHGLVLLPVLLSLVGPTSTMSSAAYQEQKQAKDMQADNLNNNSVTTMEEDIQTRTERTLSYSFEGTIIGGSEEGEGRIRTDSKDSLGSNSEGNFSNNVGRLRTDSRDSCGSNFEGNFSNNFGSNFDTIHEQYSASS